MQTFKQYSNHVFLSMLFVLTVFVAGCGNDDAALIEENDTISTIPTVLSTAPFQDDSNVSLNTNITAFFNKELNTSTVNETTFTLTNSTGTVAGTVGYANKAMIFNPTADLSSGLHTATITTGVTDSEGNALATDYIWSFTTGADSDNIAPTVVSTNPDTNDTNVSINASVSALFNETLNPSTVTTDTFTLTKNSDSSSVAGVVSYESDTMIFNPTADLLANTKYDANITTGVKDLAGNALAANKTWSFTTGATTVSSLAPVNLGTAGSFVILAKTAITTTGTTAITGDIGVSPSALSDMTGFNETLVGTYATSALVTGKIYAANMTPPTPTKMTTAVSDMQLAYTNAAGRTLPDFTELYAGDVSGKTLAPGLYKWGTNLSINTDVTISGSATDVWIFQIAQDLIVANGVKVTLAGGALAKNIFWQVAGGTGVSLGTTSEFKGVVLAQKGIVVNTGATVKGRLLAQTAVTLDANAVTQP